MPLCKSAGATRINTYIYESARCFVTFFVTPKRLSDPRQPNKALVVGHAAGPRLLQHEASPHNHGEQANQAAPEQDRYIERLDWTKGLKQSMHNIIVLFFLFGNSQLKNHHNRKPTARTACVMFFFTLDILDAIALATCIYLRSSRPSGIKRLRRLVPTFMWTQLEHTVASRMKKC